MKILKAELIEKLEAVKPGLSNKEIIEFADSFSFNGEHLITYNDFICVKCPLDSGFIGTIKADAFYKIVKQIKPDKEGFIEITEENNELHLKAKKAISGVPINREGSISLEELGQTPKKWSTLPDNFAEGIRLASFCASKDASNAKLTCLHIDKNMVESSDGLRAFRFTLDSEINQEFLLPAFISPVITQHQIQKYNLTKNWIHFKTKGDIILSCRMYQEQTFPDTSFLFDKGKDKVIFPEGIKESLERAIIFLPQAIEEQVTQIQITKKSIQVSSQSEAGWFKEKNICKNEKEVSFEINPFFLKDILKNTQSATIIEKNGFELLIFQTKTWQYAISISVQK